MHRFCKKVIEHMYETRMEKFLSSFHDLYRAYGHLDEDVFFREWFERQVIRDLVYYFSPSAIVSSYEEFRRERMNLLKTYVRIYWRFCKNPASHPARIGESLRFFGLEELDEESLVKRYRELVRRYHPDRAGKDSNKMMAKINYHYQILRRYISDRCNKDSEVRKTV